MPSHNTTNLKSLLQEVKSGEHLLSSPNHIQILFNEAAREDLSRTIDAIATRHQVGVGGRTTFRVVHYTSIPAVLSMLENPEREHLRMYSTIGSNDPEEGKYVYRDWPNASVYEPDQGTHSYAYVASFILPRDQNQASDAANNLAFWRSYGREGTGCSLTVIVPEKVLQAVKYGSTETNRLCDTVDHFKRAADAIANELGVSSESLNGMITLAMEKVRYLYKSEAYDYEQECRAVQTPTTIEETEMQPIFDHSGPPGQERVKRYINHPSLASKGLFVTGSVITLGPTVPHREDTKAYIKQLLEKANLPGTEVTFSEIPYRNSTNYR